MLLSKPPNPSAPWRPCLLEVPPPCALLRLSKPPNPSAPWRPCLLEVPPPCALVRLPKMPVPRRRHLLRASNSPSPSSSSPDEGGRWKKVPHAMREAPAPEAPQQPTRRWARAAWRKVASWVPRKARGVVLLNLITVVFASNISVVKEAEAMLDPDLFNMLRFTISAIPFVPFLLKALKDMQVFIAGLELGFWVSLAYLAQAIGLVTADAGRASFISALTVIIVPFLDGILGAVVPTYTWLGAFLSLIGVAMLEFFSGSPPCVGDLLNLLSALCFAIHMLRTEHISRNVKKENFLTLVGCEVLVVALISTAWFIIKRSLLNVQHWNYRAWSWTKLVDLVVSFPWLAILYTGIFSTAFCLWAELAAMRDVSATETAIIYGLEPVWGAAFAWVIFGERWSITGWVGAILIIASSLMVQILGSFPKVSRGDRVTR